MTEIIEMSNWALVEPQGIFRYVAPKKITGRINGADAEILMQDILAFDPDAELFRIYDGRIVRLGNPLSEFEKAYPGCRRRLMQEAGKSLPRESLSLANEIRPDA